MFPFTEFKSLRFLCVRLEFRSYMKECFDSIRDYLKYRQTFPPLAFTLELEFAPSRPYTNMKDPLFVQLDWTALGTPLLQLAQSQTRTSLGLHIRVLPGFSSRVTLVENMIRSKLP